MSAQRRVVVTGLGATTPIGGDASSTWAALLAGKSGVRTLAEDWANTIPVNFAARVAVEPSEVMERVELRKLDRSEAFALIASREAWKDAGSPEVDNEVLIDAKNNYATPGSFVKATIERAEDFDLYGTIVK